MDIRLLKTVCLSFIVFLCVSSLYPAESIAAENNEQEQEKPEDENTVTVTGSRIKRTEFELANPVVVIKVEDLEKSGFANVYDALTSLSQATGWVRGEQTVNYGNTATQPIDIRGFGPGRTLALLNGKRVTDNPTASYNGGSYFNWAIIPIAAVERVEIFTGGASAIYGSDAVAGVINVILKEDLDDVMVTARYGETPEGGGESHRLQLIGGSVGDNYSFTYALEHQDQRPILGYDRAHLDSALDDPNLVEGEQPDWRMHTFLFNLATYSLINPTEEQCTSRGAFVAPFRQAPAWGNLCYYDSVGEFSIRNDRERNSLVLNFDYAMEDDTEFYASALYWDSSTNSNIWKQWVQYNGPTPSYEFINSRYTFEPDEVSPKWNHEMSTYVGVLGLRGMWGETDWQTGLNYSRSSEFISKIHFRTSGLSEIATLTDGNPWAPFSINDVSDNVTGLRTTDAVSQSMTLDFSLTGILMEMDAGEVSYAAVAEYQHSEYEIIPDELSRQTWDTQDGWTNSGADFGAGERDHYALGLELSIPLTEHLEVGLASRYDDYQDDSAVRSRLTHQANILYRPSDNIIFRAAYNESFRAPDMHYLFRERSDGWSIGLVDTARCRYDDENNSNPGVYPLCLGYGYSARFVEIGNPNLVEESGKNIGAGVVIDFTSDLSMSIDYYLVELNDQVERQTEQSILEAEANCWLGTNAQGDETYDRNSEECQSIFAVVYRDEPIDLNGDNLITANELGYIRRISQSYINISGTEQSGVDITLNYHLDTENLGKFKFSLNSTHVNTYEETLIDITRDVKFSSREPTEKINLTTSWYYNDLATTLFINKISGVWNRSCYTGIDQDGNGYLASTSSVCNELNPDGSGVRATSDDDIRANLRFAYQFTNDFSMSLQINNITDEKGPVDKTQGWPYTNNFVYNITGREVFLEARYRF